MVAESRIYQAYYTKSDDIVNYMTMLLDCEKYHKTLEPCAGDGVFIDKILNQNPNALIDAYELHNESFIRLSSKYNHLKNITLNHADTLTDADLLLQGYFGGVYDRIIANPPYGAWQDYQKRDSLKKTFPNLYIKETYALFLYQSIRLLKENGRLVFIIPDTFLTLHLHKQLRHFILSQTCVENVTLFPSSFFPNVNFGYANMCIIALKKCSNINICLKNEILIRSDFKAVTELNTSKGENYTFIQDEFFKNRDHAFFLKRDIGFHILSKSEFSINDVAHCVTGFYSGNDKLFLKTKSTEHKNAKNYEPIKPFEISKNYLEEVHLLDGIEDDKPYFVPIVKGGSKPYFKPNDWFMNWSKTAVAFYKKDKKARFQNANFYFKNGLGIPMVSSSTISAALLEKRLFDQSIVGVFPHDEAFVCYLLAFFNTSIANKLIRAINNSTNNSANYIKKIPFLNVNDKEIEEITLLIKVILNELKTQKSFPLNLQKEINLFFENKYNAFL